jgi:hypothetical protein
VTPSRTDATHEPRFELVFDLGPQDVLAYNRHWATTSPAAKRRSARNRAITVGGLLLIGLGLTALVPADSWASIAGGWAFVLAAVVVWVVVWPRIFVRQVQWQTRRKLDTGRLQDLLGTVRLTVDAERVAEARDSTGSQVKWEVVRSVEATPEAVYLMLSDSSGYLAPTRAFASAEDAERFAQWAEFWRARATGADTATQATAPEATALPAQAEDAR